MNPEGNGTRRHVKSADKMDVKGAIDEPSVKIPVQIAIGYHVRVKAVLFLIQSVGGIGRPQVMISVLFPRYGF
jgi:hypothetical protein